MHIDAFDQYIRTNSIVHQMDPRVKVILTVAFIFSNALLPDGSWLAFSISWFLVLLVNDLSRLGLGYSFKRSFVALPFFLVAVSAVFSPSGTPIAVWDLGFITLTPTDFGLIRFFSIVIRSWLSVQIAILLVSTTQFPSIIHAFEHLRVPRVLTMIIAFLYRYLYVLTDEALRLMRARESRSAGIPGQKGGGKLTWRIKVVGSMVGQLLLRSYERSDRIYHAMLSRGYSGYIRTLNPHIMHRIDWMVLFIGLSFLIVVQTIGWIL
jgi:cobalt/nickel transport system permease protein